MKEIEQIGELFGTLQESITKIWRYHLSTNKHSVHEILNDYYKEMPEYVDSLIEHYMGIFGKSGICYTDVFSDCQDCALPQQYLGILRTAVKESRYLLKGETELESDLDDILGYIDSTLYKLNELTDDEHCTLSNYLQDKIAYSADCCPSDNAY